MQYKLINPINENYTPIEQILTNRGIPFNEIDHYLHPTPADNLSPLLLENIEAAGRVLMAHIQQCVQDSDSKIWVVTDCDCDGFTSSALLLNYIHSRFPSIVDRFTYLFHEGKQHGLSDLTISIRKGDLIICPDSSSNDYQEHKLYHDKGVDILVLDHHIADHVSEYACVVNNQLCDYPTKSLSGVGIVYKLCQYLDSLFDDNLADEFLDIVAIGLTGDMMDQRDIETHYLTQLGLNQLKNPFIAGMADKNSYSIGDCLSPYKASFYIVPLINAVIRVGSMDEKKLLFESMLDWKAYELIPSTKRGAAPGSKETRLAQALRVATNVKNRQTTKQDAGMEVVEATIQTNNLLDHKILLIQLENASFDTSITGLIANKVMAKYQRPVALLVRTIMNGKLTWSGSARGYSKSSLQDFRQFCKDSGLVCLAEGHPQAFGLGIYDENIEAFMTYADQSLKDLKFEPSYKVDFIYNISTIHPQDILDIGKGKSLWGQEINEPLIALEHVVVSKDMLTLMAPDTKPTIKIVLPNGIACIKFKSSQEEFDSIYSDYGVVILNIIGTCEVNRYGSKVTPQIIVEDYEIVDYQDYLF